MKISAIIITKNEEEVISDAIKSLRGFAEEVILIDSNSSDKTANIAQKMGARVLKHPFIDFSDQRNFGILHSRSPWVLYLDADERLTDNFKREVLEKIKSHDEFSATGAFYIRRKTYYYGRDWHFEDKVQRLFYRKRFVEWRGAVHETPIIKGEFGEIKSPIEHYTHRNLSQMIIKTNEWSEYEAALRFKKGHPRLAAWRFLRVMLTEFLNSFIKNKGYKNGTYGLIEAIYQSYSIFITYAKLWEKQVNKN